MGDLSLILAQRLRTLRKSRGLTYVELSNALKETYGVKISKESLTNYEVSDAYHTKAGKNEGMSVKYLRCLADFYQVSTDYLLGVAEQPSRDVDMQAACEFTGLSNNAVSAIKDFGDSALVVFEYLLANPRFLSMLLDINTLALDGSVLQFAKAAEDVAKSKSDSYDFTEKLNVELEYQEKYDVREYRLVMHFKKLLDSTVSKLISHPNFQEYGAKISQVEFESEDILFLRNLMQQGGNADAVNPSERN